VSVPAISVLMPVYNSECYLDEAIRSIRTQTFTDFEFVIVNDGSTDGSLDIIRRHAAEDARIVALDIPNSGIARALNRGLAKCRGCYIARMDADDVALPDRFDMQVAYLEQNQDIGAVGARCVVIDDRGTATGEIVRPSSHDEIEEQFFRGGGGIMHPVVMLRGEVVHRIGGYDEGLLYAQDLDFFLRMGEVSRLANLAEFCLQYRQHAGQVSIAKRVEQMDAAALAIAKAGSRRGIDVTDYLSVQYAQMSWRLRDHGERLRALSYAWRAIRINPRNRLAYRYAMTSLLLKRKRSTQSAATYANMPSLGAEVPT